MPHFNEAGLGDGVMRTLKLASEHQEELDRAFGVDPQADRRMVRARARRRAILEGATPTRRALPDDVVVLPNHYARFAIEPIYFIGENRLDFLLGNVIKYAMRADHKHATPAEDVSKAVRYLIMRTKKALGDPNWAGPYKSNLADALKEEFSYGS